MKYLVRNARQASCYRLNRIIEHIRTINDPEHPLTLEQLAVVSVKQIHMNGNNLLVEFTPTVPHCGQSALIGL